jgi:aryl-alcohol dehydrogenase-like predicted oxidoreductase
MDYVNLGNSGLMVSKICLGTLTFGDPAWRSWVLDVDGSRPIMQKAFDLGITFFDTADMYSMGASERVVGQLLKEMAPRDEYVVATKVHSVMGDRPTQRGLSRKHIMEGIEASLERLDLDYVDIYITHRWDYTTPIEETMEALHDVKKAGLTQYIGASSMHAWQFAKAQAAAESNGWTKFISMQNHYNLVCREEEREMIPMCIDQGVAVTPWSPLARGFLAGNRHRQGGGASARAQDDPLAAQLYYRDADFAVADQAVEIARQRGAEPAQVALAWMLAKPGIVAPVIGVSSAAQLEQLCAATDFQLSSDEIAALEAPYLPKAVMGHD